MNGIFGIGTDIVDIFRIKKIFNKNKKLKRRLFSNEEIKYCESKKNKIAYYSKRFAAKEAFAKSLGTGISKGILFNEISIINTEVHFTSTNINRSFIVIFLFKVVEYR